MSENTLYQTYFKDCDCSNGGIIIYDGIAVCRWCIIPYAKGGEISYKPEHFKSSHSKEQVREWEIVKSFDPANGVHDWVGKKEGRSNCEDSGCGIHSVRRKLDGFIFSSGEEVGSKHRSKDKIKGFSILNGDMFVHFENESCSLYWLSKLPERKATYTKDEIINKIKEWL